LLPIIGPELGPTIYPIIESMIGRIIYPIIDPIIGPIIYPIIESMIDPIIGLTFLLGLVIGSGPSWDFVHLVR